MSPIYIASSIALLVSYISLATPSLATQSHNHTQSRNHTQSHGQIHNNGHVKSHNPFRLEPYSPTSFWVPSPNQIAQNVLSMRGREGIPASAAYMKSLRSGSEAKGVYGYEEVDVTERGLVFATEVQIGSDTYEMVIDTGSSDTWLPKSGFQCAQPGTGDFLAQSACEFGPLYNQKSTFTPIPDQNFHVTYTDGESLWGTFGTEKVTVAGIEVKNQQIAVVDKAAWYGDTVTSGLLGLAFPAATKAFSGNDYRYNTPATQKVYNPIFTNMYTKGHVAPLFSIALDRNQGGLLAFGGLPPVEFNPVFASSPFQLLTTSTSSVEGTSSSSDYTLYTITTDGFDYDNSTASQWSYENFPNPFEQPSDSTQLQVIIDTATTLVYLPRGTADAINALFSPPPLYNNNLGYSVINCKAVPPRFGVKIGTETFYINPADMVVNLGSRCISGVAASGEGGTSILGHTFLKNVLAVFDVGAQMMRFAARENY
ncbi:MAG: hypothetical protein Q9163_004912 [Psora crenata]